MRHAVFQYGSNGCLCARLHAMRFMVAAALCCAVAMACAGCASGAGAQGDAGDAAEPAANSVLAEAEDSASGEVASDADAASGAEGQGSEESEAVAPAQDASQQPTASSVVQNEYQNIPAGNVLAVDDFAREVEEPGERTILDTRKRTDYFMYHFEWDSVNIPADQMDVRAREALQMEGGILLVCANAQEADAVWAKLEAQGYPMEKVQVLDGGVAGWMASGNTSVPMEFQQLGC